MSKILEFTYRKNGGNEIKRYRVFMTRETETTIEGFVLNYLEEDALEKLEKLYEQEKIEKEQIKPYLGAFRKFLKINILK